MATFLYAFIYLFFWQFQIKTNIFFLDLSVFITHLFDRLLIKDTNQPMLLCSGHDIQGELMCFLQFSKEVNFTLNFESVHTTGVFVLAITNCNKLSNQEFQFNLLGRYSFNTNQFKQAHISYRMSSLCFASSIQQSLLCD